jgi:hypothetical protein
VTTAAANPYCFLSSSTFPSVKVLAFRSGSTHLVGREEPVLVESGLLQSLEALVCPVDSKAGGLVPSRQCKVLYDYCWTRYCRTDILPPRCDIIVGLRMYGYTYYGAEDAVHDSWEVKCLADTLRDLRRRSNSLELLILPECLGTGPSTWAPDVRQNVHDLLDFLAGEGIKVDYEDADKLPLSEVFLAHVRD